jgi:hypothetical protein
MGPAKPTTDGERKVIRWFFGLAFVVAVLVIVWGWHTRARECTASCQVRGFKAGSVHLNKGGRFNIGTHCECTM